MNRATANEKHDGLIHFSTAHQRPGTLEKYCAAEDWVAITAFSAESFEAGLKWETSRGGELFPHLYAALFMTQFHSVESVEPKADR